MAEPALLDPSPFDLRHYPAHLFDPDLPLAGGDLPLGEFAGDDGLDFDLPVDFSVDDFLLRSPDRGGEGDDSGEGSAAGSGPVPAPLDPHSGAAAAGSASLDAAGRRGAAAPAAGSGAPQVLVFFVSQLFSTARFFSLEGSLFPNFFSKNFLLSNFFSLIFHLKFFFSNFSL